jgi:hypothetical protein
MPHAIALLALLTLPQDDPAALARRILDDAVPAADREALVADHPGLSTALIRAMTADLACGTPEEYRRIPWIWRVAVAAGRRADPTELRPLLEASLPAPDAPLLDWQAVVLGGGLVNGLTLAGRWPHEVVEQLLGDDTALRARWARTLELAASMADDPRVPVPTRYDALRIVGLDDFERRAALLFRHLLKGVDPELQQGAINALADNPHPAAAQALLSGWEHYTADNRGFVLEGLLRTPARATALLDAVDSRRVSADDLGPDRRRRLREHPDDAVRARAATLVP